MARGNAGGAVKIERLQGTYSGKCAAQDLTNESAIALPKLSDLQQRLAHLARWIDQVRERQFPVIRLKAGRAP
jgi:hypothetical protein